MIDVLITPALDYWETSCKFIGAIEVIVLSRHQSYTLKAAAKFS